MFTEFTKIKKKQEQIVYTYIYIYYFNKHIRKCWKKRQFYGVNLK